MPRPRRTKVAPSAPNPRIRKSAAKVAVQRKAPVVDMDDIYDVSDRDYGDASVAKAHAKPGSRVAHKSLTRDQNVATGATDGLIQEVTPVAGQLATTDERDQSDSLGLDLDLDSSSPAVEIGRRSMAGVDSSSYNIGNFKRRTRQLSIISQAAAQYTRLSSVDSDMAEAQGLVSVGKRNALMSVGPSERQGKHTDASGTTITRGRSASIGFEMGATPARPQSLFKIGTFKRRAREPSILRTGQKQRQPRPAFETGDEEDIFNPEDESTPLNPSKTKSACQSSSQRTPTNPESRKRKLSAVQVPQTQSSPVQSIEVEDANETVPATADQVGDEEEARLTPGDRQPPERISAAETPSKIIALPRNSSNSSSSSPSNAAVQESIPPVRRTLRRRTPSPATQDSPISSPPSLTHSPNRPAVTKPTSRSRRVPPPPSLLSTAQLQDLLPRRRRRPAGDPFDLASSEDEVDASGLASEDDELSLLTARPSQRKLAALLTRTPAPLKKGLKSKVAGKRKLTYGSRSSDKENDAADVDANDSLAPLRDDPENAASENSQAFEERVGKELKKAAQKFKEVDQWELEFEDVTASSSSPRDGR